MMALKLGGAVSKLLIAVAAILCVVFFLSGERQDVADSVYAQDRAAVIREVEPGPPHCIELDSHLVTYRTLTILGAYLPTTDAGRLQFRQVGTR